MKNKKLLVLGVITILSGFFVSNANAESDSIDSISVSVPVSCSMTSTVNIAHTATVNLGTYEDEIGETTFNVLCNDANGFSVYAVGYSDDTYGNTVMVPSTVDTTNSIATGTATSGNVSNWAMKLSAVAGDYAPTLETGFNAYHAVPSEYTKVASFAANTDSVSGSSFKSTYATYVAQAQPADTYTGKVKYTVVHPSNEFSPVGNNQIGVIYDGNGLTFSDGATANRVVYERHCEDEYGYIGNTPSIIKTNNLGNDGTKNESYYANGYFEDTLGTVEIEGAQRLKIVITYGLGSSRWVYLYTNDSNFNYDSYWNSGENISGTKTYVIDGNYFSVYLGAYDTPDEGYDYGFYAEVYPIYDEEVAGVSSYGFLQNICSYSPIDESYQETTRWFGHWLTDDREWLYDEDGDEYGYDVVSYLNRIDEDARGTNIKVLAYYPYSITYNGNQATVGTMTDFDTHFDSLDNIGNYDYLLMPNYLKTGYGFAGWSENQAAIVGGNSRIYGPTERGAYDDLDFGDDKTATLYAVWVPSAGNLQGWTGCSSMSIGEVTALTDTRDGNTYAVAKYDNGKCWMIENLRLDPSDANTTISAGNTDTNNPTSDFLTKRQAIIGSTSTRQSCTSSNSSCVDQISFSNNYINTSLPAGVGNTFSNQHWLSYGVLYNWYTATAGNGTYSTTTTAAGDLCPSGWHLPTGGSASGDMYDFAVIFGQVGTGGWYTGVNDNGEHFMYPYNMIEGDGHCYIKVTPSTGMCTGMILSSTPISTSSYHKLGAQKGQIHLFANSSTAYKYYTLPARCVAN